MAHLPSSTSECGTSDDQWTNIWTAGEHGLTRHGRHHGTVYIVSIVLDEAILMNDIRMDGLVR
jgi:hypothetical protein